jgi:hypothetical protein
MLRGKKIPRRMQIIFFRTWEARGQMLADRGMASRPALPLRISARIAALYFDCRQLFNLGSVDPSPCNRVSNSSRLYGFSTNTALGNPSSCGDTSGHVQRLLRQRHAEPECWERERLATERPLLHLTDRPHLRNPFHYGVIFAWDWPPIVVWPVSLLLNPFIFAASTKSAKQHCTCGLVTS